jgi:hypothetical protein
MPGFFDSQVLAIACPGCRQNTRKTVEWLRSHTHFMCSCGARVNLDAKELTPAPKKIADTIARAATDKPLSPT